MTKKPAPDDDTKPGIYGEIASKDTEVSAFDFLQDQITELAEWQKNEEQGERPREVNGLNSTSGQLEFLPRLLESCYL